MGAKRPKSLIINIFQPGPTLTFCVLCVFQIRGLLFIFLKNNFSFSLSPFENQVFLRML